MRFLWAVILVGLFVLPAAAQVDSQSPQVATASADAVDSLEREVLAAHVTPDLTVKDLLDRAGGGEELAKTLRGAEQIGGTRWLDEQTVQVRLSIDGKRVARTLLQIVESNPKRSPVGAAALKQQLAQWSDRTFSATGTSTGSADVTRLRPPPTDRAWWGVSDVDRRQALIAARDNAVSRVLGSLRPIPLDNGKTLGEALSDPAAGDAIKTWLESRPVKVVEFGDDLSVRLTLAAPTEELWGAVKSATSRQKTVTPPADQGEWDRLQQQVSARSVAAEGASAVHAAEPPPGAPAVVLPAQAPSWVNQQAQAEAESAAVAPGRGAKLQTARAAEASALEKLRHQIDALPLSGGMTVGAAAQRDPRIEQAVIRSLARARPYKVDYGPKGAVTVYVSFHLSDLWAALGGQ